jgi:PhnB protein
MQTRLNPYLNFRDNTREAMEFYKAVFGGKLILNTFKEFNASHDPSEDNKIMHSMLEADNGITFMAADTPNDMEYRPGTNLNMSLSGDNETELRGYFEKLSAAGTVMMPLDKAPWGDMFGMVTDKFGIQWLVNISSPNTSAS